MVAESTHTKQVVRVGEVEAGDWIKTGIGSNLVQVVRVQPRAAPTEPLVFELADGTERRFFDSLYSITTWREKSA